MASLTYSYSQSCDLHAPIGGKLEIRSVALTSGGIEVDGGYYQLEVLGLSTGLDYGTQLYSTQDFPFPVTDLPNQQYTLKLTYRDENGTLLYGGPTRQLVVSCGPYVCDFRFTSLTFPGPGTYRLTWSTAARDGQAFVGEVGNPATSFQDSPYLGTGTPGQTLSLVGEDKNGCQAFITVTLPLPAPTLTLVSPDQGPVGTTVLLTGTRLLSTTQVTFHGVSLTYQVNSDTELEVVIPSTLPLGVGQVQITVGNEVTNTLPYTVTELPIPPEYQEEVVGWTLSWQLDFNSWTGEHTTIPQMYLTRGKDTYREGVGIIRKQTKEVYGLPLTLEVVDREGDQVAFDTLVLQQEVTDPTQAQPFQRYTTLSSLSVRTEYHHTGTLIPYVPQSYQDKWSRVLDPTQVAATFEKDQYQVEIPGSVVIDIDGDITSPANQDPTKPFKPRLSGKWALLTLGFAGTQTQKYLLHTLRVVSRPISR